jgi:hypothetical protein
MAAMLRRHEVQCNTGVAPGVVTANPSAGRVRA